MDESEESRARWSSLVFDQPDASLASTLIESFS